MWIHILIKLVLGHTYYTSFRGYTYYTSFSVGVPKGVTDDAQNRRLLKSLVKIKIGRLDYAAINGASGPGDCDTHIYIAPFRAAILFE